MKIKLLILSLLAGFILVSCEKEKNGLDPNAKISVTVARSLTKADAGNVPAGGIAGTGITDSLEFITKYAFDCRTLYTDGMFTGLHGVRGFGLMEDDYYMFRDLEHNRLKFSGADVISSDGFSLGGFVTSVKDILVTIARWEPDGPAIMPLGFMGDGNAVILDTVAYIPNSVVLEARAKITAAFAAGDYDACYKLFDEAYVFLPTTGPKWRALKASGIE